MNAILRTAAGAVILTAFAGAHALSITTLFNRNNGGSNGGAVYFDVVVGATPITVTGFDTNTNDIVASFGWTVYTFNGSYVGNQGSSAGWTQVATGTGVGMGMNVPSPVTLNGTFNLNANTTYGMALVIGPEAGHDYSGTGTSPLPGATQYMNADVTLNLGSAANIPFTTLGFTPRIWNGTMYYDLVPEPGTFIALGIGLAGLAMLRRRK